MGLSPDGSPPTEPPPRPAAGGRLDDTSVVGPPVVPDRRSAEGAARRPDAIRRHNLAVMLSHIHRDGPLTRAQLTARLGVSRSTIGALVGELSAIGVVEEVVPSGGAGVGRPSHTVGPRSDGPVAVAVDVDVTAVTVATVGLGGRVLARETQPFTDPARPPSAGEVARLVAAASARLVGPRGRPVGVGVSVPGTVDRESGHVGVAPNLGWLDVPLGRLLADHLPRGTPIVLGNDADLAALAEYRRGAARDASDAVYLLGRVGVGAGIIAGGVPLRGRDGHAGEIGHSVVDVTGPPCHCGKHGCLETYVGDGALLALAGRDTGPGAPDVTALFADAAAGDPVALDAVRRATEPLGRAIANLVNTLNPELVLLGGTFASLLDLARTELEASVARFTLEAPHRSMSLRAPAFGSDCALYGAAEIALDGLLADPLAAVLPA